jgi:hypothetical protein
MVNKYRYVVHELPNERSAVYDTSIGRTVCNGMHVSDSTEIANALNIKEEISYILQHTQAAIETDGCA